MSTKGFISTLLCVFLISSLSTLSVSAAKSTNLENAQIVDKVKLFNESKLKKLNRYILQINTKNPITKNLVNLYQKLDNFLVSDINIANEINEPANKYLSTSVGSQLERLFSFLDIINRKYTQDTFTAEMRAQKITNYLISRINQIDISKSSGQLDFKSKQEKIDHIVAYLHYIIPHQFKNIGIDLANKINKTFENNTYKDDAARKLDINLYVLYRFQNDNEDLRRSIMNEFNKTFA